MQKALMIAIGLCVGLVVAGPMGAVRAHTVGGTGIGPGAENGQGPYYWPASSSVSCSEGRRIVASNGFRKVTPVSCHGNEYTYRGTGDGGLYKIILESSSGRIEDIEQIRHWDPYGWNGDYGGEDDYSDRGYGYGANGFGSGDYGAGFDDDVDF
jgi:hypothetical protein